MTQHGSNITEERLRFDFNNDEKWRVKYSMKSRNLSTNGLRDLPVSFQEYPTDKAFEMGAIGAFGDKYGDSQSV